MTAFTYFNNRYNPSPHMAVTDTCAGCHFVVATASEVASKQTSNHSFVVEVHRKRILHRDLKPENLLITDQDLVKVADFGVVKFAGFGLETTHGRLLGTPAYMAPEYIRGRATDGRMDVYSMSMILYEALSGVQPMGGIDGNLVQVCSRQLDYIPPPLASFVPGVPGDVSYLVQEGLEKDPERRIRTMRELGEKVQQALEGVRAPSRRVARNVVPSQDQRTARTAPMESVPSTSSEPAPAAALPSPPASQAATPTPRTSGPAPASSGDAPKPIVEPGAQHLVGPGHGIDARSWPPPIARPTRRGTGRAPRRRWRGWRRRRLRLGWGFDARPSRGSDVGVGGTGCAGAIGTAPHLAAFCDHLDHLSHVRCARCVESSSAAGTAAPPSSSRTDPSASPHHRSPPHL